MSEKKSLLFAAGGTGGHLFPATAVAEYLRENYPDKYDCVFIGTENRIESEKVPKLGFEYYTMPITGFPGKNLSSVKYPMVMYKSIRNATKVIKKKNIAALICTGAYIGIPPGISAKRMSIPIFILESNVRPGKAIKLLAPNAKKIYTTFEESSDYFRFDFRNKIEVFGNPLRSSIFFDGEKENIYSEFNLDPEKKTVFVFGGSLGAASINNAMLEHLEELSKAGLNIIWQTGNKFTSPIPEIKNLYTTKFIDDMSKPYAIADLVVSRSGATTVTELAALHKPAVLIPLPGASNNEQMFNAELLKEKNACLLLDNKEIKHNLGNKITELIKNDNTLKEMSECMSQFSRTGATKLIAEDIISSI